ncbi:MAG: aminotransferase class V-fold PLP-dependent enzyme [Oscillospiraceae bacterium]|nr:aminotransferase class V-fold PLP-dependent enzyme [Oscillospiraceae bacterium]
MIYLDCAATSLQKPREVPYAVSRAMTTMASPGRGCHKPAMAAADCVLNCRLLLASYFNVSDPENVVFTFNATHGLNIAIKSLISENDRVVISGYEHNSVTRPLRALNADVLVARSRLFDQKAAIEAFRQALPGAKCAVCTHVSNAFGFILPIREIAELCHEYQVPLIIDASQSAGTLPLDFEELGAEFIAMPGHKGLLGPQGTGVLLCSGKSLPILFGGTGSNSADSLMPEFLPDRLEAGTHNVSGVAGLTEGIKYIMSKPDGMILRHEKRLCGAFAEQICSIPDLTLFFDESMNSQSGVLSVMSERLACDELAERLGNNGICVRAGLHCTPTAHETVGTIEEGTVRFSFSPFNTYSEIEYAAAKLKNIMNKR